MKTCLSTVFPRCKRFLPDNAVHRLDGQDLAPEEVPELLADPDFPPFLPDLAKVEMTIYLAEAVDIKLHDTTTERMLNPSLQVTETSWTGLDALLRSEDDAGQDKPLPGNQVLLTWMDPVGGHVEVAPATERDLLALKVTAEKLEPVEAAAVGGVPVGVVDGALRQAEDKGLLIGPPSRLLRTGSRTGTAEDAPEACRAEVFTLQWHITQQCDLHCKHCYDRSDRSPLTLEQGIAVLDDMRDFCRNRRVQGQVTFTGGNPLMHPDFLKLYKAAYERHMLTGILGNPTSRKTMESINSITKPAFYQVSLEGLQEHNDAIRGFGHFDRTMAFLDLLQEMDIFAQVMLTLTRANMNQVLSLGEMLKGKADSFTFNRLSPVGEGASLAATDPQAFQNFLEQYRLAAQDNPVMQLKDNLFNILLDRCGEELFGGCTGHGCGAAFNFVSLLSDGEVHACRKFHSPIGNMHRQTLAEIYDSELSRRYRDGSAACGDCRLHAVCGGCLAVTAGLGHDPFVDRDPYCFIEKDALLPYDEGSEKLEE